MPFQQYMYMRVGTSAPEEMGLQTICGKQEVNEAEVEKKQQ